MNPRAKYKSICFGFGSSENAKTAIQALEKLDEEVEKGIRNGWVPQGGISISVNQTSGIVAQAMIRENL
jgi:hypothetical protein